VKTVRNIAKVTGNTLPVRLNGISSLNVTRFDSPSIAAGYSAVERLGSHPSNDRL
jgi:hypothetical protein